MDIIAQCEAQKAFRILVAPASRTAFALKVVNSRNRYAPTHASTFAVVEYS